MFGHGGEMPGYHNSFASSEDGTRQAGSMTNFSLASESASDAHGELSHGAFDQAACG
jgi:hypothetical protein